MNEKFWQKYYLYWITEILKQSKLELNSTKFVLAGCWTKICFTLVSSWVWVQSWKNIKNIFHFVLALFSIGQNSAHAILVHFRFETTLPFNKLMKILPQQKNSTFSNKYSSSFRISGKNWEICNGLALGIQVLQFSTEDFFAWVERYEHQKVNRSWYGVSNDIIVNNL